MKRFILKGFIFLIPFIFSQPLLDYSLRKSNCSLNYQEWNDIVQSKINADVLILGNSRAWVHISPRVLDSVFNINSYNLGIDGYHFGMQYARFQLYLKYNKKPKYIIQTTDYLTLGKGPDLWMYEQFIPFLNEDIIRKVVLQYNGIDEKDIYIPFYKYFTNSELFTCAMESIGSSQSNGKYKGFQAMNARWDTAFTSFKKRHINGYTSSLDSATVILFDNFVKYCQENNIKLIFVNPPSYYEATQLLLNKKEIDTIYQSYSKTFNIPFLNYNNDSICYDTANFYNSQHMNWRGTMKFNKRLSDDLRKILPWKGI